MFNVANVICVKLISNSGRKLSDNQLEYISIHNDIPLLFLREMRANNYFKIYFEKTAEKTNSNIVLIAHSSSTQIYFLDKFKKIPEILKAQIKLLETVKIPKENVINKNAIQSSKAVQPKSSKARDRSKKNEGSIENKKSSSPKKNDLFKNTESILKLDLNKPLDILKKDCDTLNKNFDSMVRNKKNFDSIFFLKDGANYKMIAYIIKGTNKVTINDDLTNFLSTMSDNINSLHANDIGVNAQGVSIFNIDDILDKISKKGIDTLTNEERDFLDNQ
jgi:hypothetical protein